MASIARLAPYPPTQARRQIPASQLASLNAAIASTLPVVLSLSPAKYDVESSRVYIQTYARDASSEALQALIWESQGGTTTKSKDEGLISKYTVLLAKKLAGDLDLQTLLDLTIGYSADKGNRQHLKAALVAASEAGDSIHDAIAKDLVPALTLLLSPHSESNRTQGLYALRKTAHCIISFLAASPPVFIRHFSHSKPFILALAQAYDTSLTSIAASYGGINVLRNTITRSNGEADDWEKIWVDTKVALIDAFHIVLKQLIEDMSAAKDRALGIEAERTFGIIFALLDLPSASSGPSAESSVPLTPFLNRCLLADYQQSYSLSRTLSSALKHAQEKDARLDVVESALAALDQGDTTDSRDPGALKLVLRSYGMRQGIDNLGTRSRRQLSAFGTNPITSNTLPTSSISTTPPTASNTSSKGKGKASAPINDPELDGKVTQILDVLPDLSSEYVTLLLGSERYKGDLEQVLGALLEDRAPSEEVLIREIEQRESRHTTSGGGGYDVSQRRNVFDDQDMDLSQVKIGKADIEINTLQDRSYMDQMKADTLRRAEAIFEEEEEEKMNMRPERPVFSPEDELEEAEAVRVRVAGDGEETDESDAEGEGTGEGEKMTPEFILELAWMRDPKLFDRDAATRRSKGRDQLRKDTGWVDEQIEGWKIMLDRNPKMQEKIKQKNEFSGNRVLPPAPIPSQGEQSGQGRGGRGRGGRGRGRGGRGGGGGSGGGRGGNTGGGDAGSTRERAFKDKHKASRANHNRKRGHDKKMARAGAGIPPSS